MCCVAKRSAKRKATIKPSELGHYRVLKEFRERLSAASLEVGVHPSFQDPKRLLQLGDYLSLMLLGLLNPVARTARGLVAASRIPKVQRDVCTRPVSLGSFSEAQGLVDVALLEKVFAELSTELCEGAAGGDSAPGDVAGWLAEDGTLWSALPRMAWALYGVGRNGDANGVRLSLSLHVGADAPAGVVITPGRGCERAALREKLEDGAAYIADRYYGNDYKLLDELAERSCSYCIRIRDTAVVEVLEELPVDAADRAAGVVRQMRVRLGAGKRYRSGELRLVHVRVASGEIMVLATNLDIADMPAAEVALLYKRRWQIEYYFRWVKCVMGCGHWMAESRNGVALQIYLALIASLLLQLQLGRRPSKRVWELMGWHQCGAINDGELGPLLADQLRREEKAREREAARQKNV